MGRNIQTQNIAGTHLVRCSSLPALGRTRHIRTNAADTASIGLIIVARMLVRLLRLGALLARTAVGACGEVRFRIRVTVLGGFLLFALWEGGWGRGQTGRTGSTRAG